MNIVFSLPQWPVGFTANLTAELLNAAAEGMAPWYVLNPLPPLYKSGVVYRLEPNHGQGWEDYADPWTVYRRGWADCDDATLWRLIELRVRGERVAAVRAEWVRPDVHVLIRRANGTLEDPSLKLLALEAQRR